MVARTPCALFASVALAFGSALAVPAIEEQARLSLTLHVLPADEDSNGTSLATRTLEIPPGATVPLELDLPWPSPGRRSHLSLEAKGSVGSGEEHETTLE